MRVLARVTRLAMIFVDGVLLAGALHPDLERHLGLFDLEVLSVSLEASGNDLQADRVAHRQHVDDSLAVLIRLELHVALANLARDGVKDHGSILDRLAIDVAHDGDLDARGGRWSFVLAAAIGRVLLAACGERAEDENKQCCEQREAKLSAVKHGTYSIALHSATASAAVC